MSASYYNEKRYNNFREIINDSAMKHANKTAFQIRNGKDGFRNITYSNLKDLYYGLCTKFIEMGYLGKKIAIIGANSFEWALSYLCAATVGVAVPIDKELQAEDVRDFFDSAECVAVCTDNEKIGVLKDVVTREINYIPFDTIEKLANEKCDTALVDSIEIGKDEMRILIFTSGTTGNSKGVCLSQDNLCANIHSTVKIVKVTPKDKTLSILPLHHTYECTINFLLVLSKGATICYCDGLTKVQKNLLEYQPTALIVVPALLKVLNKRIKKSIAADCPAKYKEYFENESLADALKKTPFIIRKIICSKVKKSLGGKIRMFIVGAAELDPALVEDFSALGIRALQGYGLTECAPLLAANNDFHINTQSTGVAVPGVQLKIDNPNDEGVGEILAKGDNIMLGYYNDPEATAEVFRDGWFCTGDLGYINDEGDLFIKGRIKNVIVTENGKNIYPEELETRLSEYPEIGEVLVYGAKENGESFVKARVFPNLDYLKQKFGRQPSEEETEKAVKGAIKAVNKKIPGYKHIKTVEVLDNALEKTTTQKIKRFGKNVK